jgi:hypothetical protein
MMGSPNRSSRIGSRTVTFASRIAAAYNREGLELSAHGEALTD